MRKETENKSRSIMCVDNSLFKNDKEEEKGKVRIRGKKTAKN